MRAAVTADQDAARAAAATKAARGANPPAKKAATRSPSDSGKLAKAAKPTAKAASKPGKAARPAATIKVISRENPYRPTSTLFAMAKLLRDGMTTAELRAAFDRAGIKGQVSGFLANARSKGLVE